MLREISKHQSARPSRLRKAGTPQWLADDLTEILVFCRLEGSHETANVIEAIIEKAAEEDGDPAALVH